METWPREMDTQRGGVSGEGKEGGSERLWGGGDTAEDYHVKKQGLGLF